MPFEDKKARNNIAAATVALAAAALAAAEGAMPCEDHVRIRKRKGSERE